MNNKKAMLLPNPMLPNHVVTIDPKLCVACYKCSDICRCNVIVHNPEKGQPPIVVYPDECWHCAVCTEHCPTGAIKFDHPINQKITWKRKDTGEIMRIGMKNPPSSNTRRACGDRSIQLPKYQVVQAQVLEVEKLSRYVIYAKIGNASGDISNYEPGHFCNFQVGEETYRGYSIGNAPGADYIELYIDTFNNGPGGQFFQNIEVGKKVNITLPLGRFIYHPKETPVLFVGSVTGISPIKAMLETELKQIKSDRKIQLMFMVWDKEDIFLKDYFDKLETEHSNFNYSLILSNPDTTAEKTGKIYNNTIGEYVKNSKFVTPEIDTYICGSKSLIKAIEKQLFRKDVFWKNIYYESFM